MSRRFRRLLRPFHPRRLAARLLHLAHLLGWHHVRLWLSGLRPSRLRASWRWLAEQRETLRRRRRDPRIKVAVDVSPFWQPLTGIGWYLYRLLEHLAERDDVALRLYGPDLVDKGDQPEPVVPLPEGPAIEVVRWGVPEDFSVVHYWLADRLRAREPRLIRLDGNEILFAPNFLPPPRFAGCPGKLVATVHDLSVEVVPETLRESTREQLVEGLHRTLERAARVITDSEAVRREILELRWDDGGGDRRRVDPQAVRAVHLAPAARRDAGDQDPPDDLPPRYVLHVGTIEPRKNLARLLEAWAAARRDLPDDVVLVLAGGRGWKTETLEDALASATEAGWLHHEGYVDDDRLAVLYRHAGWLVLPSVYEGFGLPAVEAMAAGVPLLLADIPVLREMAGDAALYAQPRDVGAWTDLLRRALGDDELRRRMARRSAARAGRFDWRRTAEETVEVWKEAVGRAAGRAAGRESSR